MDYLQDTADPSSGMGRTFDLNDLSDYGDISSQIDDSCFVDDAASSCSSVSHRQVRRRFLKADLPYQGSGWYRDFFQNVGRQRALRDTLNLPSEAHVLQETALPPCQCDFVHLKDARLERMPVEILGKITDYATNAWTKKRVLGDPAGRKQLVFSMNRWIRVFHNLRVSKSMNEKISSLFADRVRAARKIDRSTAFEGYSSAHSTYRLDTLKFAATRSGLQRLEMLAENPYLCGLIETLEYEAFDFPSIMMSPAAFQKQFSRMLERKSKSKRNTWGSYHSRYPREVWENHTMYYSEHQEVLRTRAFDKALIRTLPRFPNLQTVKFTRLRPWEFGRIERFKLSVSLTEAKTERLGQLREPVYWNGFFRLAAVAASHSGANSLVLQDVMPDLSLVPRKIRSDAEAFTRKLKSLDLGCAPDSFCTRIFPTSPRPQCRDGWKEGVKREMAAWQELVGKTGPLTSLLIDGRVRHECVDSTLAAQLVTHVEFRNVSKLSLSRFEIQQKELQVFLQRCCNEVRFAHFDGLRVVERNGIDLIDPATWMKRVDDFPELKAGFTVHTTGIGGFGVDGGWFGKDHKSYEQDGFWIFGVRELPVGSPVPISSIRRHDFD